jgi:hypothetical protein
MNNQTFEGLLVTDTKLIPRDPKCHCGPLVGIAAYGDKMIYGVSTLVHFTVSLEGPQHILGFFQALEA